MTSFQYDAVLVDGDNVSRVEVMMLRHAFHDTPIRKFFGGANHINWGWFGGMEFVAVPKMGKESVDRAVAMEAVRLYLQNDVRSLMLVSHDMDYGDTAVHLKSMFGDMDITIAANPSRVGHEYQEKLQECGVHYEPLFDLQRPAMMARMFDLHQKLAAKHPQGLVRIEDMGSALIDDDQYMTRKLKPRQFRADMRDLGFFLTEKAFSSTPDGQPALVVNPKDEELYAAWATGQCP